MHPIRIIALIAALSIIKAKHDLIFKSSELFFASLKQDDPSIIRFRADWLGYLSVSFNEDCRVFLANFDAGGRNAPD